MTDTETVASTLIVAPARWRDLLRLQRLFERATTEHFSYFPAPMQRKVIASHSISRLAKAQLDKRRILLVARDGNQIVGYCIGAVPNTGPAQLFWLYMEPQHRGTNTGLRLLSRMLKLMEQQGAQSVFLATHDHRRYYERQGFKYVRQEPQGGVMMDIMGFTVRRPS